MNDAGLTPHQRLATSRKAILRYMNQDGEPDTNPSTAKGHRDGLEGFGDAPGRGSIWTSIKRAARLWWQHHPAQLAVNLAQPALSQYAKEKPLQMLGIAAGAGAAVVVLRPWRLISVTGLLLAALKASDLPVLLMSIISQPESTSDSADTQ